MEININETLSSFPNLRQELERCVALSNLPTNGLFIRIGYSRLLETYYEWATWKLDPRGMRLPRIAAYYRPPNLIEMDIGIGRNKPRLRTVIRTLFHELGHYKAFWEWRSLICDSEECPEYGNRGIDMTEKGADLFARIMMKEWDKH